jgi:DNA-binding NarL/FixJ family response regulator
MIRGTETHSPLPPRARGRELQADKKPHRKPHNSDLTPHERQIAHAITQGLTNRQIAQRFTVSEQTVKNQLTVIYHKLDVKSRLELASLLLMPKKNT